MIEILLQPSHPFDAIPAPSAFEQLKPELVAFPKSERVHLNHDVPTLVTTILGTLPALRGIRQQLVDELTHFDAERFDRLVLYARALYFAHLCHRAAERPRVSLKELVEEASVLRNLMLPDVLALANRGLIAASEVRALKREPGHRGLAQDLQLMAMALTRNAARVSGKTAISAGEIERASYLSDRLLEGVGVREHGPEIVREAAELRMNAFSILVRLYEDIRAAVTYVRRKLGDADSIAPSLFAGRGGRKREAAPEGPALTAHATAEAALAAPAQAALPVAGEPLTTRRPEAASLPQSTPREPILTDTPFAPRAPAEEHVAVAVSLPGSPPPMPIAPAPTPARPAPAPLPHPARPELASTRVAATNLGNTA